MACVHLTWRSRSSFTSAFSSVAFKGCRNSVRLARRSNHNVIAGDVVGQERGLNIQRRVAKSLAIAIAILYSGPTTAQGFLEDDEGTCTRVVTPRRDHKRNRAN
jgi:hypothetical protein